MSETVYETLLALEIKELEGKNRTEALPYFRERLGEPSDIDEIDGEVEYFEYNGDFTQIYEKGRWGVAYVLGSESTLITLGELNRLSHEEFSAFRTKDTTIEDFILADLHWYNGVDRPYIFRKK